MNKPRFITVKSRPGEKWKEFCPGYWLSNCGRWWSTKTQRVLKQDRNDSGYYRVTLFFPCGKVKKIFTHISVVFLFGDINGKFLPVDGLAKNGLSIDHISRVKRNNSVFNLEIVPHRVNVSRFYVKIGRSRQDVTETLTPEETDKELFD